MSRDASVPASQGADQARSAPSWETLTRAAFASTWDPSSALAWDQPIDRDRVPPGWIAILQHFYDGEWQGLEIIQRLMNRAAHQLQAPELITYYSTQCYDESKHLHVFRRYLEKVGAPPVNPGRFDLLVALATRGPLPVERWILATWFTETLAAVVFQQALHLDWLDPLGRSMIQLMLKDESRHIAGTRATLGALVDRAGRLTTAALQAWWRLFLPLAVREVRRLGPHAEGIGLDPEHVLRDTLTRMRQMNGFAKLFLRDDVVERLLAVR